MKVVKLAPTNRMRELVEEMRADIKLDEEGRKEKYRRKHKKKKLQEMAFEMAAVEQVKEYVKLLGNFINAEYDVLRLELIPAKMEDEDIENVTIEKLGRLGLSADLYVSTKAGGQEAFFKWLRKNKMGSLIQETVNASTLKAFVKSRIENGKPVPRDLLNVTPYTRASITKA